MKYPVLLPHVPRDAVFEFESSVKREGNTVRESYTLSDRYCELVIVTHTRAKEGETLEVYVNAPLSSLPVDIEAVLPLYTYLATHREDFKNYYGPTNPARILWDDCPAECYGEESDCSSCKGSGYVWPDTRGFI